MNYGALQRRFDIHALTRSIVAPFISFLGQENFEELPPNLWNVWTVTWDRSRPEELVIRGLA